MAFLRGFFGLVIFLCLFYCDEALRRDVGDESFRDNESSAFGHVSSDLLELRAARTDAKLVRSHETSLSSKASKDSKAFKGKNKKRRCKVKVGDTTCEFPGRSLSPKCCNEIQKKVCHGFKEQNVILYVKKRPCNKLNLERAPSMKACKNLKDGLYLKTNKEGEKCMKGAVQNMKDKLEKLKKLKDKFSGLR
eukprot:TRINITY_DN1945_c0_g3_i1.p1 TRINITY_DN1945_c0_g3~~TRINITY_DN1945_c0_g3_i1.p1  ORF type:complete len:192 (-),score=27.90 TRINITY_DN1945_c0_g3_i1:174-749(-)